MLFHEAVYTSASALLEGPSGSDLGIVAKTRGFPVALERELDSEQYYSLLPGVSIHDIQAHPPRFVVARRGSHGEYFCVSRAVFAGADHTGRTTPLVHHLAFNVDGMATEMVSPAAVLAAVAPVFHQQWKQPPAWIDPPRTLPSPISPERLGDFPSPAWKQLLGQRPVAPILAWASECLIAFPRTRKPLVLSVPVTMGHAVLRLIADLLALIPREVQLQCRCASHVIESADCPADAAILFTYPEAPFFCRQANRADDRAPVLFDFVATRSATAASSGRYATAVTDILQSTQCAEQLWLVRESAVVLESCAEDRPLFPMLWRLYEGLRKMKALSELESLAETSNQIIQSSPRAASLVAQWANAMMDQRLMRLPPSERWGAISGIAWDKRWPQPVKGHALKLIRDNACEALPAFVSKVPPQSPGEQLRAFLAKVLTRQQQLVASIIRLAIATGRSDAVNAAVLLINASSPGSPATVADWMRAAMEASDSICASLLAAMADCVCPSVSRRTPEWFDQLTASFGEEVRAKPAFRRDFQIPLLRRMLSTPGMAYKPWSGLAAYLVEMSLQQNTAKQDIGWLASEHRGRITDEVLGAWKQRAEFIGQRDALADTLQELGLWRVSTPPAIDGSSARPLPRRRDRRPAPPPRRHSLTLISWTMAFFATLALFAPMILQRFGLRIIGGDGMISFKVAAVSTGGALLFCFLVEMILRIVKIPITSLRYARLVRWFVILAMLAATALSVLRLVDVAGLFTNRAG